MLLGNMMEVMVAASTYSTVISAARQIFSTRAANDVMAFKSATAPLGRPMADCTPLVQQHVVLRSQTRFR